MNKTLRIGSVVFLLFAGMREGIEAEEGNVPLPAVENATASQGLMGVIRVIWDPVDGAASYELRRNASEDLADATLLSASLSTVQFDDHSAESGRLYFYWVKAKGALGESDFSRAVSGYQVADLQEIRLDQANMVVSPPAIDGDGKVYVTISRRTPTGPNPRVVALDAEGEVLWEFPAQFHPITDIVLGVDGTVYFAADRTVFALNPDGTLKWEFTASRQVVNAPAVTVDSVVFAASNNGTLYALDQDGLLWERFQGPSFASCAPLVGPDHFIYLDGRDAIAAVTPNGNRLWETTIVPLMHTSPSMGEDGTLYVGLATGHLQALNPDGTGKWRVNLSSAITGAPLLGEDGTIFCASSANLHAIELNGAIRKTVPWQQLGTILTPLILGADGSIFFGTSQGYVVKVDQDFQFKGSLRVIQPNSRDTFSDFVLGPQGSLYWGGNGGKLSILKDQTPLAEKGWPTLRRDHRQSRSAAGPMPSPETPERFQLASEELWAGMVRLQWEEPAVLARFHLWRNTVPDSSSADLLAEFTSLTHFDDRSAEPGVTYYYWLKAFNNAGESGFAGPVAGQATSAARLLWEVEISSSHLRPPAVGLDGLIYVADANDLLHAIEPDSGIIRWTHGGVQALAIHENGALICSTGTGLLALDPGGNAQWEITGDAPGTLPAISTGGSIYWGSGTLFQALSPEGEVEWALEMPHPIQLSPSIGPDGSIYFGTQQFEPAWRIELHAVSPDGALKWEHSFDLPFGKPAVIGEDGTVYIVNAGGIHALDSNGGLRWTQLPGSSGSAAISPGGELLVPAPDGHLHTFRSDGTLWWHVPMSAQAPAIAGDGTIFVDEFNRLSALSSEGDAQWRYERPGGPPALPRIGAPILSDLGTIYFTSGPRLLAVQTSHPAARAGWTMFRANSRHTGSNERMTRSQLAARLETEGFFRIEFTSRPGALYRLEISEDLANWTLLETVVGQGATTTFREAITPAHPTRFYRVGE